MVLRAALAWISAGSLTFSLGRCLSVRGREGTMSKAGWELWLGIQACQPQACHLCLVPEAVDVSLAIHQGSLSHRGEWSVSSLSPTLHTSFGSDCDSVRLSRGLLSMPLFLAIPHKCGQSAVRIFCPMGSWFLILTLVSCWNSFLDHAVGGDWTLFLSTCRAFLSGSGSCF